MRLLTHNLMCCLKCKHFPLDVVAEDITFNKEQAYDRDFTQRMLGRIEYEILAAAVEQIRAKHTEELAVLPTLPPTLAQLNAADDSSLHCVHVALSGIMVRNGTLVCPSCTTEYPITEFIPNLMSEQ